MTNSGTVESQVEQIDVRLANGHSSKAEKAFNILVAQLALEELISREESLRTLCSKFLPAHKARHRRLEDLLDRKISTKSDEPPAEHVSELSKAESGDVASVGRQGPTTFVLDAKTVDEREFEQLIMEMRSLGFTHSNQVSNYIKTRRLGCKYPHISGLVTMENDGGQWPFEGGFPKHIYARLCNELGLRSQGTTARAVKFVPFSDLK